MYVLGVEGTGRNPKIFIPNAATQQLSLCPRCGGEKRGQAHPSAALSQHWLWTYGLSSRIMEAGFAAPIQEPLGNCYPGWGDMGMAPPGGRWLMKHEPGGRALARSSGAVNHATKFSSARRGMRWEVCKAGNWHTHVFFGL